MNTDNRIFLKKISPDNNGELESLKKLYVESFYEQYKDIPLEKLNKDFKTQDDIKKRLSWVIDQNMEYAKTSNHFTDIYAIQKKDGKGNLDDCGVMIIEHIKYGHPEHYNRNNTALHIRHVAIDKNKQRFGIGGDAFIEVTKLYKPIDEIVLDVRNVNEKAQNFYKKQGFAIISKPFDNHLSSEYFSSGKRWEERIRSQSAMARRSDGIPIDRRGSGH